ncbi:TetR/AcrR family transcriptional regulator [Streptomyces aidingensis]|uniref:Regulatory protein, tetR family n=1 Tax=Streptomyces aidingensis TaxID=910347 RepID=A0A1I1GKY8_9ACTN|nr:TetR/AcrR family transcriptional regulator [Streptomyces aidingensis]SFC12447.1 regulatory protein, tetR family [Streptomyces aidingensis]
MAEGRTAARRGPEHTLELLWRTRQPGSRGPRGSLTLDEIVRTAMEIADAEGIAGLSMRKVAERFGLTTMSLYRYVPGKDELLELMFDAAAGQPDTARWPEDWRGGLAAFARGSRAVLLARPWTMDIPISGPPMGPNNLAWMEAGLSRMNGTPLTEEDMVGVLMILSGYVLGQTRLERSMDQAFDRTGVSYEEAGRVYGRLMTEVVRDGRFPTLARIIRAGVFESGQQDAEDDFAYGLDFVLDGVAVMIRDREAAGG